MMMSILVNETWEVNEIVSANRLKYCCIILHTVWVLAQLMAAPWPVPASNLWCNARHGLGDRIDEESFPVRHLEADTVLGEGQESLPMSFVSHKWHLTPGPQDCALFHVVTYVKLLQTAIPNSMCLKTCWINPFWIPQNKTKKLWSLPARHSECLKHCIFLLFMPAVITSNPALFSFSGFVITQAEERKKDGENSALRHNTKTATDTTAWTVLPSQEADRNTLSSGVRYHK